MRSPLRNALPYKVSVRSTLRNGRVIERVIRTQSGLGHWLAHRLVQEDEDTVRQVLYLVANSPGKPRASILARGRFPDVPLPEGVRK